MRRSPSDLNLRDPWPISLSSRFLMPNINDKELYKLEQPRINGENDLYALELTRQSIIEGDTRSRPISFLLSASERFFATGFVRSKSLGGFFTPEAQEGLTRCEGVPPGLCFGGTLGHPSTRNELLPALGFRMLLSPERFCP